MTPEDIKKSREIIAEADWDYMPIRMATCISSGYIEALDEIERLEAVSIAHEALLSSLMQINAENEKFRAVIEAAKGLDGYHSEPCERNVMMKENPECDCGLDNLAKALEALES